MFEVRRLDVAFLTPDLNVNQRVVLLYMARRANKFGSYWEAQATLADQTGLSLSSVRRAIGDLIKLGLIKEVSRGHLRTKRYRILDEWMKLHT